MFNYTNLIDFIKINNVVGVKLCLEQGVNPTRYPSDQFVINLACYYGNANIVRVLLEDKRIPVTINGSHYTLAIAGHNNHPEVVKLLLEDNREDVKGASELIFTAVTPINSTDALKLLVPIGVNYEFSKFDYKTTMNRIKEFSDTMLIKEFLKHDKVRNTLTGDELKYYTGLVGV